MPDGNLVFADLERRTFTKDGQEKPVWNMKDGEGRRFSTFDAAIAKAIEEHKGQPLAAQWSEKQRGEFLNRTIVALPGLVEKQAGGGGGVRIDEDRADRRAALEAAVAWCLGRDPDVFGQADAFLAWLQTSAGGASRAVPASHEGTPAEPSYEPSYEHTSSSTPAPRNPWNIWIEQTFPHLDANEHRRLVKAALSNAGLEKLPDYDSQPGLDLRAVMTP